jgi:sortase A
MRRPLIPTSVLRVAGELLITLGVVVLLFAGFELWGTGIIQRQNQDSIRQTVTKYLPAPTNGLPQGSDTPLSPSTIPAEGDWIGMITIPAIHLSQVIIQGTATNDLRVGPGHYLSTPMPGEAGNVAIAGHRTTWAEPFRHLDQLHVNDPIIVVTPRAQILYRVLRIFVVQPDDLRVIAPTTSNILTLTTCNPPYSAATRLVVQARLAAVQPVGGSISVPLQAHTTQVVSTLHAGTEGWWHVVLYGTFALLLFALGRRWLYLDTNRPLAIGVLVVLALPVLIELFIGISWILPAGY